LQKKEENGIVCFVKNSCLGKANTVIKNMKQWRIQGGQFGATTPSNGCGVPLKWHPSDKNAPLFVAYRSRNKDKITQSKLNNALHFVELQDSRGL